MDVEDAPLIYGLELPARCLCPQVAETNSTRYLVATQSLRQENQIHLITFDDENNHLEKTIFAHSSGEIWHIASSFNDPSVFSTCYSCLADGDLQMGCKVWRLPHDASLDVSTSDAPEQQQSLNAIEEVADLKSASQKSITHVFWKPVEGEHRVMSLGDGTLCLWDLDSPAPSPVSSFQFPEKKGHSSAFTNGKWNPHHGAKQFAVASGQHVMSWDVRANEQAFRIDNAHSQFIRDLDFNPNKQYFMATCGDDCQVKFWDVRQPTLPASIINDQHSHWVWSTRFNPFHDQLVLSCASDSRVVLYNKASISSEPFGHHLVDDDADDVGSDVETGSTKDEKVAVSDGLIAVYEEHEDSVYAVEWSAADPWSFASLSYDGRVVINKVPKKVKFDILL